MWWSSSTQTGVKLKAKLKPGVLEWWQHLHFWLCGSIHSHHCSKPLSILWLHPSFSIHWPVIVSTKKVMASDVFGLFFVFSIIELQDSSFSGNVMLQCSVNSPPPSSFFRSVPEGPWQRGGAEGLLLSRLFFTLCLHDFGVLWWPLPLSTPLYPLPPRPATPVAFLPCRQRRWLRPFQIVRPLAQQRLSVQQYPCGSSIKVLTTSGDRYCLSVR